LCQRGVRETPHQLPTRSMTVWRDTMAWGSLALPFATSEANDESYVHGSACEG
jgi:hypothetical protein